MPRVGIVEGDAPSTRVIPSLRRRSVRHVDGDQSTERTVAICLGHGMATVAGGLLDEIALLDQASPTVLRHGAALSVRSRDRPMLVRAVSIGIRTATRKDRRRHSAHAVVLKYRDRRARIVRSYRRNRYSGRTPNSYSIIVG